MKNVKNIFNLNCKGKYWLKTNTQSVVQSA